MSCLGEEMLSSKMEKIAKLAKEWQDLAISKRRHEDRIGFWLDDIHDAEKQIRACAEQQRQLEDAITFLVGQA